jgi:hypothetical protein
MTETDFEKVPAHTRFLAESGYDSPEAWALDSDYIYNGYGWHQTDNPNYIDIMDCLYDAMDACGWKDPNEDERNEASTMAIHLRFHTKAQREAFNLALTGQDDDVLLAAEAALNARLGLETVEAHGIWIMLGSNPEHFAVPLEP